MDGKRVVALTYLILAVFSGRAYAQTTLNGVYLDAQGAISGSLSGGYLLGPTSSPSFSVGPTEIGPLLQPSIVLNLPTQSTSSFVGTAAAGLSESAGFGNLTLVATAGGSVPPGSVCPVDSKGNPTNCFIGSNGGGSSQGSVTWVDVITPSAPNATTVQFQATLTLHTTLSSAGASPTSPAQASVTLYTGTSVAGATPIATLQASIDPAVAQTTPQSQSQVVTFSELAGQQFGIGAVLSGGATSYAYSFPCINSPSCTDVLQSSVQTQAQSTLSLSVLTLGGSYIASGGQYIVPAPPSLPTSVTAINSLSGADAFVHSPQAATLAGLSLLAYPPLDPLHGAPPGYTLVDRISNPDGLIINAYRDSNGNIVVAFRGTEPSVASNFYADLGFFSPTPTMSKYVQESANFLSQLVAKNPSAQITLTGHSLGGGLAEILGHATGLTAVGFNAPGSLLADGYYQNQTAALTQLYMSNLNPANTNLMNVTLQGDPISTAAPTGQIGQWVVLQNSAFGSTATNSAAAALFGAAANQVANLGFFADHAISSVIQQMSNGSSVLSYTPASDVNTQVGTAVIYTSSQILGSVFSHLSSQPLPVQAHYPYVADPATASGYIFRTGLGNPNFESIGLPLVSTSQTNPYEIDLFQNGGWQFLSNVNPLTQFYFPIVGGVDQFRVLGLDGLNVDPNSPFYTLLTFVGDGQFTGTIDPIVTPEPSSLVLLASGLASLIARRQRLQQISSHAAAYARSVTM